MTGFNSKREAAADKLQEPEREALTLALIALHTKGEHHSRVYEAIAAIQAVLAQPAQEPVAYVTGTSFGRFIVEPLNRAMVLPIGMALYSSP